MNEKTFEQGGLRLCDWQYTIRHASVDAFKCGEKVFLKSNPEHPMTVYSLNKRDITTFWFNTHNEIQTCDYPPECILQYKYAALLSYRNKFFISLN